MGEPVLAEPEIWMSAPVVDPPLARTTWLEPRMATKAAMAAGLRMMVRIGKIPSRVVANRLDRPPMT